MTPDECYSYVSNLQADFNARCRDKQRWVIVEESDGGYSITDLSRDGIGPSTIKPTKRDVAARFLQLLGLGPVAPQDYPEDICVGHFEYANADMLEFKKPE